VVSRSVFSQSQHRCRLDWGRRGAYAAAERGDALVVVDTLSFSTAVATAIDRGVLVHPCRWEDDPSEVARGLGAEFTVKRTEVPERGQYSLSPGTLGELAAGTKLVVRSLNGATCTALAGRVPNLFVAGLVNASAVSAAVDAVLRTSDLSVTVVACGERWEDANEDGPLRVAVEDYLGAGAVLSGIRLGKSPEARVCEAAFRAGKADLPALLAECGSGLELRSIGFEQDVTHAAKLDCYDSVPVLHGAWVHRLDAEAPAT
jgi:2-phosphosulfolactate phosphatase